MTITVVSIDQGPFTATGLAQTVAYTFMTLTDEEISVFYDAGAGRVMVDPASYVVARNKNIDGSAKEGGSVELSVSAVPAGSSIYIRANPRGDRDLVWSDTGSRLKNLNEEQDRQVLRFLVVQDTLSKNIGGMAEAGANAGSAAGAAAGTAAANAVVAGKADIAGENIVQRRTFRINLNERTINVLDYIPTNLHSSIASRSYFGDVSPYIQQAYDDAALEGGATVYAPSGSYPLRTTLNITGSGTVTRGDGVGATLFMPMTDYGDVFHAYPASGPNIQGVEFHDFGSYTQVDTTSGNIIRLTQANNARIGTTRLAAHHGGVYLEGSVHCHISGSCDITSDANFAAFRPGSHLLRVGKGSTPTIPAEIHIDSVDWRGQHGNNHLHHALLIEDVDGLFMTQPHLGFCRNAISMIPRADDSILYSVNIAKGYLDTVSENGLNILDPTGSYAGGFGMHVLEFATIYNTGQSAILMFLDSGPTNMLKTTFDVHNTLVIGENGIDIGKGRKIEILPGYKLSGIRAGGAANKGGIVLQGAVDDVSVGEGIIERGASANAPTWGIFIGSSVTNFTINRARIRDCLNTVSDNSGAVNKSVATPLTY
jgi:hypothetical protein